MCFYHCAGIELKMTSLGMPGKKRTMTRFDKNALKKSRSSLALGS